MFLTSPLIEQAITLRTIWRRVGCACCHRCSPDRVGSGEVGGAGIGSRCVGSHSGETPPDIPILKEAKAEYAKLQ
jgi:hypothetical protein